MARQLPIEPEEWLSRARWMRAMALSLVNDASSADDIVQESMVAALGRSPDLDPPGPAWLSRVVRNVASNFRRGERRLAERHAARGAGEVTLDPATTIEQLDTQRLIVDLVRELDEPARSTIVMRYFEGLSSPEIGRRMGVSDATVRWRMQQALDELRGKLQRKFGSRDAWCAMLLPFANSFEVITGATTAASATAGAMAMGAMSKVAVAAVSLSIVGAGLWFALERDDSALHTAEAAAPASKETPGPIEPVAAAVRTREVFTPAKEPVAKPAPPASEVKPVVAAPESNAVVRMRFVDAAGQPWDRVLVRVIDPYNEDQYRESTTGGPDGRAELSFAIPESRRDPNYQFVATRSGCATSKQRASLILGGVVDLGEVVLEREARVQGLVHDAQGIGHGDVTVGLSPVDTGEERPGNLRRFGSKEFDRSIVTRSDSRGAFELGAVPAGKWRLWGNREGLGYGVSEPFEVQAGEEKAGVDFQVSALLATDTVSGVVLGLDGEPASNIRVGFQWTSRNGSGMNSSLSRADGRFEVLLNGEVPGELGAEDKEHRLASAPMRNVPPGARDLVLQLAELGVQELARLRVHGPVNEPVSGIKVMVVERQKHGGFMGHPLQVREIETGLYEFQVPGDSFKLTVSAEGYVNGQVGDLEPRRLPAELDISLEVASMLHGRVSSAGLAVAAALVEAMPVVPKGRSLTVNGIPSLMNPITDVNATTAPDGKFTLNLQGKDPIYLRCVMKGFAPTIVGPFEVESVTTPIEIELTIGGAIEGRVRAKDGTPIVGAIVGITCGDGHPRTMLSGRDGAFRFEGLSLGSWLVLEHDEEISDGTTTNTSMKEHSIEWSCTVVAGRTTYFDLTLNR